MRVASEGFHMAVIPKELQIPPIPLSFQSIVKRSVGFEHGCDLLTPHFYKIVRTQLKTTGLIFALMEKSGRRERHGEEFAESRLAEGGEVRASYEMLAQDGIFVHTYYFMVLVSNVVRGNGHRALSLSGIGRRQWLGVRTRVKARPLSLRKGCGTQMALLRQRVCRPPTSLC
jgi:hypothetical protein